MRLRVHKLGRWRRLIKFKPIDVDVDVDVDISEGKYELKQYWLIQIRRKKYVLERIDFT
jgi:hypothetical protein